nr:MAG TPA: hypothetical protein [Caudoviricetes sp.]
MDFYNDYNIPNILFYYAKVCFKFSLKLLICFYDIRYYFINYF